jgi:hypothetical protein
MKTELFVAENHMERLNKMLSSWGLGPENGKRIPKLGYINEAAACFLIPTTEWFCYVEFLVSDRDNEQRDLCVDEVLRACTEKAKRLGFESVYGLSENPKIKNRIVNHHGFEPNGIFELYKREL